MAINGFVVYGGILGLAMLGLGIFVLYLVFKPRDEYENSPLVINLGSRFANGKTMGYEVNSFTGKNGRKHIQYVPTDIDFKKGIKDKSKQVEIIVEPSKIIPFPQGTWSEERNVKLFLPPRSEYLLETMKHHPMGQYLVSFIERDNAKNHQIKVLREENDRLNHMAQEIGNYAMSKKFVQTWQAYTLDMFKNLSKEEIRKTLGKTDTPSGFRPPQYGGS